MELIEVDDSVKAIALFLSIDRDDEEFSASATVDFVPDIDPFSLSILYAV